MENELKEEILTVNGRLTEHVPFCRTNSGIKDVNADLFIRLYARHLRTHSKISMPKWCNFVKTGKGKHLAPTDNDWYFVRAASILRQLYYHPDTGVCGFRKIYSCNQRRGVVPNHTSLASGKIIRSILQELEHIGFVEQDPKRKGRRLTRKGQNSVDSFARHINSQIYAKFLRKKEVKEAIENTEEQVAEAEAEAGAEN